jgi:hypothetical protein
MSDRWFKLTAAFAAGAAATLVVQGLLRNQSQDRRYGKQQWWLRGGANYRPSQIFLTMPTYPNALGRLVQPERQWKEMT